ncbi:hypothetical protein KSP39_PZI000945 [Platanthera zijinensis]|uniref:Uncharacterized protein n=1 Tax=Platanthera zijinensis TaxID=2320716 RepID=A0AAP0GF84_9ASPA
MEPMAFAKDRIKLLGEATDRFVKGVLQGFHKPASHNPIEIIKRLQREAFSDIMKLRERQEKMERLLSFHQSVKGGPFREARSHMKGIISVDGALIFLANNYQQASDNLNKAGARRCIDLRFIFETPIGQRDLLVAEFLARHHSLVDCTKMNGSPLTFSKLVYSTNISDWFSAVLVPIGARCIEFGIPSFHQGRYESRSSSSCPPLYTEPQCCGIGFSAKESNTATTVAGLVSGAGADARFAGDLHLSTFWQVSYMPSEESRLTMSGIWKAPVSSQLLKLAPFASPEGILNKTMIAGSHVKGCSSTTEGSALDCMCASSVALMLGSQFNESMNLDCWVEMRKSSPGLLKWGFSFSDAPPHEELGWGLKVGGQLEGQFIRSWAEGFLNINLGKKAVLQPGFLYVVNGESRTPAILLRSSWFM